MLVMVGLAARLQLFLIFWYFLLGIYICIFVVTLFGEFVLSFIIEILLM